MKLKPGRMADPIINELIKCEHKFLQPEFGTSCFEIENMIDDVFWEVGASGKLHTREHGIDVLVRRSKKSSTENVWETTDLRCLEIAPNNYLLTYTLAQGKRITRRSSIWRLTDAGWKVIYHQGTLVQVEE